MKTGWNKAGLNEECQLHDTRVVGLRAGMLQQVAWQEQQEQIVSRPFTIPAKISFCKHWSSLFPAPSRSQHCLLSASTINRAVVIPSLLSSRARRKSWHILPQSWKTAQSHIPQCPCSKKTLLCQVGVFKTCFMLVWPLCIEVSDRCVNISQ